MIQNKRLSILITKFIRMKKYMLFIREDLEQLGSRTEEELQNEIQVMTKWVEELSKTGNYISGEPLEAEIRVAKADEIIHTGPSIELKEGISGYMVIAAENIDQASALAQGCPLLGTTVKSIEVRPIFNFQ
jgi:hypothetical protein